MAGASVLACASYEMESDLQTAVDNFESLILFER